MLEPVYSSVLAVFLFHEVLTLQTGIGAVVIIGGIWYYVRHPGISAATDTKCCDRREIIANFF
jgi:drug/metabolite transporter (DMT)-like permease